MFLWLKQFMPRGLYGRAALILILPIVALQLVVSVVFIQRHFNRITVQMTHAVVVELEYVARLVNDAPTIKLAQEAIAPLIVPLALDIQLPSDPVEKSIKFTDLTGHLVEQQLEEGVRDIRAVDLRTQPSRVIIGFDTRHGPMRVSLSRERVSATNPHQLLVLMVGAGLLMTLIAYLFLRNQLRPIRRLARASEAFGKGQVVPYKLAGATEVRAAGKAFLDMRSRIERQIEQRTLMLSGISHDLRTPLTRLKLGLSMIEDETRGELERDVDDMARLVDTFLNFARAEALDDPTETLDPNELARDIVEKCRRAGQEVQLGALEATELMSLRRIPIERALENLTGNATRYGRSVMLSVLQGRGDLRFVVEDDGPGIPVSDRSLALKPFARLDAARNQNNGSGVGLGLAIASDIARSHGGHLRLGDSENLGGLKAELVIPL